jgi:subtilisin-like proprotein convertase family protein
LGVVLQYYFNGINTDIPDANPSGLVDPEVVSTGYIAIQSAIVDITIQSTGSGAFNGDRYAYLSHGGGIAVLLNRRGVTGGNAYGYEDIGFTSVRFSDSAANGDVHLYQTIAALAANGALTGTWPPDGRNVNPATVLDSTPRNATLGTFIGADPSGSWTLFVADMSGGGTARLVSWSLNITAVPEPVTCAFTVGSLLIGFALWRVRRR